MKIVSLAPCLLLPAALAQQVGNPRSIGSLQMASPPSAICADGVIDQAAPGNCIPAASIPTWGMLYPLGLELFISSTTGNVGLRTGFPQSSLHVADAEGMLVEGNSSPTPQVFTGLNLNSDSRLFFSVPHAALRAGSFVSNFAGFSMGKYSVGFGLNSHASGASSAAWGSGASASGDMSTAFGQNTLASGRYSLAGGLSSVASDEHAFAMGVSVHASAYSAVAFGSLTEANGTCSLVQGINAIANGDCSTALGSNALSDGYCVTALGRFNVGGGDPLNWVATDPLLEVGNGSFGARSNALTVLKNGRVGIGTAAPGVPLQVLGGSDATPTSGGYFQIGQTSAANVLFDDNEILARNNGASGTLSLNNNGGNVNLSASGTGRVAIGHGAPAFTLDVAGSAGKPGGGSWSVSSDARLKKNVRDLDGALERVLALRGVTYEYIDPAAIGELSGERIGFVAQEVERVFPDWVGTKDDGMRFLTIRGFEALAVEALRDLRDEIQRLREELRLEREARVQAMSDMRQLVEQALRAAPAR